MESCSDYTGILHNQVSGNFRAGISQGEKRNSKESTILFTAIAYRFIASCSWRGFGRRSSLSFRQFVLDTWHWYGGRNLFQGNHLQFVAKVRSNQSHAIVICSFWNEPYPERGRWGRSFGNDSSDMLCYCLWDGIHTHIYRG